MSDIKSTLVLSIWLIEISLIRLDKLMYSLLNDWSHFFFGFKILLETFQFSILNFERNLLTLISLILKNLYFSLLISLIKINLATIIPTTKIVSIHQTSVYGQY